jgi:hypothetical protein
MDKNDRLFSMLCSLLRGQEFALGNLKNGPGKRWTEHRMRSAAQRSRFFLRHRGIGLGWHRGEHVASPGS